LRCYPLKYHEQERNIAALLRKRGKVFRELCLKDKGEQMFQYSGNAFFNKTPQEIVEDEWGGGTGPFGMGFMIAADMQKREERVSWLV
jgi:hypothetical protein